MLERKHRLTKRKEFNYIFKKGKAFSTKLFVLNYSPTKLPTFKVGFSVSKKIGNAVIRNKVKRIEITLGIFLLTSLYNFFLWWWETF